MALWLDFSTFTQSDEDKLMWQAKELSQKNGDKWFIVHKDAIVDELCFRSSAGYCAIKNGEERNVIMALANYNKHIVRVYDLEPDTPKEIPFEQAFDPELVQQYNDRLKNALMQQHTEQPIHKQTISAIRAMLKPVNR